MFHVFGAGRTVRRFLSILMLTSLLAGCSALGPASPTVGPAVEALAASLPPRWSATPPQLTRSPTTPTAVRPSLTPTPARLNIASAAEASLAFETSSARMLNQLIDDDRTVALEEAEPLIFHSGWCAASQDLLEENYKVIETRLVVSGFEIDPSYYATRDYSGSGDPENPTYCRSSYVLIDSWPSGMTYLEVRHRILETLSDGWDDYAPQVIRTSYIVYIEAE